MKVSKLRPQTGPREVCLSVLPDRNEKDAIDMKNFCRYVMIHAVKCFFEVILELKHYNIESANFLFFGIPVPPKTKLTLEENEKIKDLRNQLEREEFTCGDIFAKFLQACCSLENKVAANMFEKLNIKFQKQNLKHSEIIRARINKLSLKKGVRFSLFLQNDSDIPIVVNPLLTKITKTPLPGGRRKESRKKNFLKIAAKKQTEENKDDEGPLENQKKSEYFGEYLAVSFPHPLSGTISQENNLSNMKRRRIRFEELFQNEDDGRKYSDRQPSQYKGLGLLQSYSPTSLSHINSQERNPSNMKRRIDFEERFENEGDGPKSPYEQSYHKGIISPLNLPLPSPSTRLLQNMENHNREPNELQLQEKLSLLHFQENNLSNMMRRTSSEELLENDIEGPKNSYEQPFQHKGLSPLQRYQALISPHELSHINFQERNSSNLKSRRIDSEKVFENEGDEPKYPYGQSLHNGILSSLQALSPSLSTGLLQKMDDNNRKPNELQRQVVNQLPPPHPQENLSKMRERMPAEQPIEENKGNGSKDPAHEQPLQGNRLSQEHIEHNNRQANEPQRQVVNELPPPHPQENLSNILKGMGNSPLKEARDAIACLVTGRKTRWESLGAPERIQGELYEVLIYRNKDCYPLFGPKDKKTTVGILALDQRRDYEIRVTEFEAKSRSWAENARSVYPKVNAWLRLVCGVELQLDVFNAKSLEH